MLFYSIQSVLSGIIDDRKNLSNEDEIFLKENIF